mmetsp:Transcript_136833/g.249450  ORF Transcript_136833/g.249450 Transcript_136833/m.249450 type:complete len:569 (-) Transcript_136833:167-1873(-)
MREEFDRMDEEVQRVPDNLLPGGLPQEAHASGSAEGPTPKSAWESDSQAAQRTTLDVTAEAVDHPADCNDHAAVAAAENLANISTSFEDVALSLEPSAPHAPMQGSAAPAGSPAQELPAGPAVSAPLPPLTAAAARRLILPPLQNAPHRGPALRPCKSSPAVLPTSLSPAPAITYGVVPPESKASWKDEGSEGFTHKCMEDTNTNSSADSITKVLLEHQLPRRKRCRGVVISFATAALAIGATASVGLLPWIAVPCSGDTNETVQLRVFSWLLPAAVLLMLTCVVSVMENSIFLIERSFGVWSGFVETFTTFGKFLVFFSFGCHAAALRPEDAHTAAVALTSRICLIVYSVLSTFLGFYVGHISRSLPNVFAEDRPDRRRNVLSAQLLWFGAISGTFGVGLRGLRYGDRSLNASLFGSVFAPMRLLAVVLLDVPHLVLGCLLFIYSRVPAPASEDRCLEEEQVFRTNFMGALGIAAILAAIVGLSLAFKTCRFDWRWIMYGSSYKQRIEFLAKKAKLAPRWRTMQRSLRKSKREARLRKERGETYNPAVNSHADVTPKAACQQEANSA